MFKLQFTALLLTILGLSILPVKDNSWAQPAMTQDTPVDYFLVKPTESAKAEWRGIIPNIISNYREKMRLDTEEQISVSIINLNSQKNIVVLSSPNTSIVLFGDVQRSQFVPLRKSGIIHGQLSNIYYGNFDGTSNDEFLFDFRSGVKFSSSYYIYEFSDKNMVLKTDLDFHFKNSHLSGYWFTMYPRKDGQGYYFFGEYPGKEKELNKIFEIKNNHVVEIHSDIKDVIKKCVDSHDRKAKDALLSLGKDQLKIQYNNPQISK